MDGCDGRLEGENLGLCDIQGVVSFRGVIFTALLVVVLQTQCEKGPIIAGPSCVLVMLLKMMFFAVGPVSLPLAPAGGVGTGLPLCFV